MGCGGIHKAVFKGVLATFNVYLSSKEFDEFAKQYPHISGPDAIDYENFMRDVPNSKSYRGFGPHIEPVLYPPRAASAVTTARTARSSGRTRMRVTGKIGQPITARV